ncbi:hypothetical protein Pst134EA_022554 [Puccinia striiformis f. sp. tritici]|uniref:hypothetical protein n=1 Tax=Puccinia striiformis f. sp. tritici TaxID=168172 RepID=UPI002008B5B9|nr:hypothetical protein Pst134EA_022554 [Puccinia striiformis f. sp. tritici]KAH9455078.1 hypothetical protein Pst134EA_022554 [Puccinia striiformis f. sp. tritici]
MKTMIGRNHNPNIQPIRAMISPPSMISSPPLSDADPDVVTSTALVCYNPNQASTLAARSTSSSFPYTSVPLNPLPGTVPVTPTPSAPRRSFANQNNSTESAPPKERPDKAKSSLATATNP